MSTPISSTGSSTSTAQTQQNPATQNQQLIQQLLQQTAQPNISFGGLVSGLNTQAIVQAEMNAAQIPVVELQNQQAQEQAKLAAWQGLNTQLNTLQSAASSLGLQATIGAQNVTFGGAGAGFATGTATAEANTGTFKLSIQQLATPTAITSTANIGSAITSADIAT